MKDWVVAFIAAASLIGMTIWCAKVFVKVLYG